MNVWDWIDTQVASATGAVQAVAVLLFIFFVGVSIVKKSLMGLAMTIIIGGIALAVVFNPGFIQSMMGSTIQGAPATSVVAPAALL